MKKGAPLHVHEGLGVPSFLWAASGDASATRARKGSRPRDPEQAARAHLARFASLYRLEPEDLAEMTPGAVHDTGRGVIVAALKGRAGGLEIFREEIKVAMDRDLEAISLSGHVAGNKGWRSHGEPFRFILGPAGAAAAALSDLTGREIADLDLKEAGPLEGGYVSLVRDPWALTLEGLALPWPARAKKLLFRLADRLEPAYYVEVFVAEADVPEAEGYAYVVSASDGEVLFRHDLTVSDSFTYRVWADPATRIPHDGPQGSDGTPHPTGLPDEYQAPFSTPSLISLQNGPISTNDPWLPSGALETTGNNVDAYADLLGPDGFGGGDLRASLTSPNVFDRTYNTSLAPNASATQRMAAITQLFYDVNFLHDWFYDSGFNEASGNAQTDNYGRGGFSFDAMRAEAQDFSGRNNANMLTPGDGGTPRMQMYVFDGIGRRSLTVNAPASIAGTYAVGMANFGPTSFTTTAQVVLVDDGNIAGGSTLTDGCTTPFANAAQVSGRIALIDRGACTFTMKVKNAQLNGAIGAIVANNAATGVIPMGGTDGTITIPSLFISQPDGVTLKSEMGAGVNATLWRELATDRDGTLDNQIVAHEWGHYISNRLIGNGSGLNNQQGGGMGEGWGDFHSLLITVRPEDANHPATPAYTGVYAMAGYVTSGGGDDGGFNNGYYFGIRRYPYSIDFAKNPLTFRHISLGTPLPAGPPVEGDPSGANNNEVHNTGEVWATMLWECYASLLRSGHLTFQGAQQRMRDYLVAGYKLTPPSPTFLEARDALLTAASVNPQDHALFYQAFARRGAGLGAVAPDRFSAEQTGVVESYVAGGELSFDDAAADDSLISCDADGVLDAGETGRVTVTLRNTGATFLSDTTAILSSPDPDVEFPSGTMVFFPPSSPLSTTTATVDVRLASGGPAIEAIPLDIQIDDAGLAVPGTTFSFAVGGHYDEQAAASAVDDVESAHTVWAPGGAGGFDPFNGWRRAQISVLDHRWQAPDPGGVSDQWVTSPPLQVGAGSFVISFKHMHSFEAGGGLFYDGGVIELSSNGGAWMDIGAPVYNGTISVTGGGNPLQGRPAFVGTSAGHPALAMASINLGTAHAGQTVRVRFRIGADGGVGAPGWDLDDIAFAGITNLPFATITPEATACSDTDLDGTLDPFDCAPSDGGSWALPTDVSLLFAGDAATLTWSASTGATSPLYDVLRAASAGGFPSALCLETGDTDLAAQDPALPGTVFYYLIRSRNACGSVLGFSSAGAPISGVACP